MPSRSCLHESGDGIGTRREHEQGAVFCESKICADCEWSQDRGSLEEAKRSVSADTQETYQKILV